MRQHLRRAPIVQSYLPGGANMHTIYVMVFFGGGGRPARVCPPNGISIGSTVFAGHIGVLHAVAVNSPTGQVADAKRQHADLVN